MICLASSCCCWRPWWPTLSLKTPTRRPVTRRSTTDTFSTPTCPLNTSTSLATIAEIPVTTPRATNRPRTGASAQRFLMRLLYTHLLDLIPHALTWFTLHTFTLLSLLPFTSFTSSCTVAYCIAVFVQSNSNCSMLGRLYYHKNLSKGWVSLSVLSYFRFMNFNFCKDRIRRFSSLLLPITNWITETLNLVLFGWWLRWIRWAVLGIQPRTPRTRLQTWLQTRLQTRLQDCSRLLRTQCSLRTRPV